MKLSDLTLLQWLGITLVINGALTGSVNEMSDLLGAVWAKHLVSIATIGSGVCGGLITMFGGIGTQARNVVSAGGRIEVSASTATSPAMATLALDDKATGITPARGADAALSVIAKVLLVAFALSFLLAGAPAQAQQTKLRLPIDPLGLNDRPASGRSAGPLEDIIGALDAKLLPDLQYALKLATASGSKVTAPCYQAWIDIIQVRQKAVKDDGGQDMAMPDPAIITKFEKIVELRNSLQPDSDFMIKCSPVASMVKKDIVGFIGIVLSGGAGLATLVPGL